MAVWHLVEGCKHCKSTRNNRSTWVIGCEWELKHCVVPIVNTLKCFVFGIHSKVHITQQTLDLLEDQYFFEPGTEMAKKDSLLINNKINTFLISPQYYGGDFNASFLLLKTRCFYRMNWKCFFHCSITVRTSWMEDIHLAWKEWWVDRYEIM